LLPAAFIALLLSPVFVASRAVFKRWKDERGYLGLGKSSVTAKASHPNVQCRVGIKLGRTQPQQMFPLYSCELTSFDEVRMSQSRAGILTGIKILRLIQPAK
jgi:hypothetical protein